MRGKWKVTSNCIFDKKQYAVYRLIDTTAVDHSGNREFATEYMEDRQEASAIAERLNQEETVQKCRICGCTWHNACPGGCYWVETDLCSKCAEIGE